MLKLLARYYKAFLFMFILAVALLGLQAFAELTLPEYMSKIVNVGIQQNGVQYATPEIMSENTYKLILENLPDSSKQIFENSYDLTTRSDKTVYVLNSYGKENIDSFQYDVGRVLLKFASMNLDSANIDEPTKAKLQAALTKVDTMSNSMITQATSKIIQMEYQSLGIDMEKFQSDFILSTGGIMLLLSFISMAAVMIESFIAAKIAAGLGKRARSDIFSKVMSFSNSEFDKFSTASLITRSTNDVQQIQQILAMMIRFVIYSPIMAFGGIWKVMKTESSMSWIIGLAVAILIAVVLFFFLIAVPKFKIVQGYVDNVNKIMRESLTGIMVIRAFGTQEYQEKKFESANKDLTGIQLNIGRIMGFIFPIMNILMSTTVLLILWVGAKNIELGNLQVGDMMAFIQYAMQIIMSFLFMSFISIMLPRATVSANRILEVLDTETTINDPANPQKPASNAKGVIEFKSVSFKYPGAEDYVLKDISFKAEPGQTVAFIGSTGSGKSTLVNLIPRFYDITEGEILLDGVDIRSLAQKDLRDSIGYVPQKGVLFSGTISSNIKFGSGNISDEEMKKASLTSQASTFIEEKQEKYNDPISQGGANVSGGQKQRLSIARALAANPKILIFDDSFSALDYKTDSALRTALSKNAHKTTTLIVAQRIGTIKNADNIIVLDEGRIAGMSSHRELLKTCDIYRQIAYSQLSPEEIDRDLKNDDKSLNHSKNNGTGELIYE